MEYYDRVTQEYLEAVQRHAIKPMFKIELMDYGENVFAEITRVISKEDSGSLSINYQQGIRRSCSITISDITGEYLPNVNGKIWINSKFKLYCGVQVQNINTNNGQLTEETNTYWFSQGVFILTNPTALRDLSKKSVTLNGVDKFGIFGSETNFFQLEGTYVIPAESKVSKMIQDVLDLNMGNGYTLDSVMSNIDAVIGNSTTEYDLSKSAQSYFGEMLVEIGNMFAADVFYDTNGHFTLTKSNEKQQMDDMPTTWVFTDTDGHYFEPSLESNFTEVFNTIKVVGTNSAAPESEYTIPDPNNPEQITASWYQELVYGSPTRASLIGRKVKYVESSFCYDINRTKDFAKYLFRKNSILQQSLSFKCSFLPHLDVNTVIGIQDSYFGYDNDRFIIQSIEMPLSTDSLMELKVTNTANIPYFEF